MRRGKSVFQGTALAAAGRWRLTTGSGRDPQSISATRVEGMSRRDQNILITERRKQMPSKKPLNKDEQEDGLLVPLGS
jgi:hypothetical protein